MRPLALLSLIALLGCSSGPTHHFHVLNVRHSPRPTPCVPAQVQVHTDRGPGTAREIIAVLTAECDNDHPEQCRSALQRAACEVNADAVVTALARPLPRSRLRLIGDAVEWQAP